MNLTPECRAVANYIIEEINKFNKGKELQKQVLMSTKKLQKLLYFCDIEYMKENNGETLFKDNFEAWPSGPVIDEVYSEFMQYQDGEMRPKYDNSTIELSGGIKLLINKVLDMTKDLSTVDLINISKVDTGPWYQVYIEDDECHNQIVSKEEMYNFYSNKPLFESTTKEKLNVEYSQEKEFTIKSNNHTIILEKNNQRLEISQSIDDDIGFSTSQKEMNIELNLSSRNYFEWQTYAVFEYLMKSIIGKYMLTGDNEKEYSHLPKDFIDLKNKSITWHSDSGIDNVLKLEYIDNRIIKISISKSKDSKEHHTNTVRIRTNSSEYGYYYQEFLEFYRHLLLLEQRLNKPVEKVQQEKKTEHKKLSLFKRYNKK